MALIDHVLTPASGVAAIHSGFDHVVAIVESLDVSSAWLERLGFTLTPKNIHPTLGTAHRLAVFADAYLELLAEETPGISPFGLALSLKSGRDLCRVALLCCDAASSREQLRSRGIDTGDLMTFRRPVLASAPELGTVGFKVFVPDQAQLGGLPLFFCEHDDRTRTVPATRVQHANTAARLAGLDAHTRAPQETSVLFDRVLSSTRADGGARTLPICFRECAGQSEARWSGMTLTVDDLAASSALLQMHDVEHTRFVDRLMVAASTCLPLDLHFVSESHS